MATSTTPRSSVTYLPSTFESLEEFVTSLQRAFPVSPIPTLEVVLEKAMSAISGPIPKELLARWDASTSCWRTCQVSFLTGMGEPWLESFPKSGMTVDGKLYQRPMLVHRTSDKDGGALQNWPTPTANEDAAGTPQGNMQKMLGNHPDVRSQDSGALAPDWVEWLMGLPIGWSKLEALPPTAYDQWFDQNNSWWDEERGLPRVGVGIKNRIKRLKALGNGLVPACVPEFLRQITS